MKYGKMKAHVPVHFHPLQLGLNIHTTLKVGGVGWLRVITSLRVQ
jgi:hypothetical protein